MTCIPQDLQFLRYVIRTSAFTITAFHLLHLFSLLTRQIHSLPLLIEKPNHPSDRFSDRFYKKFINRINCNTCHFVCKVRSDTIAAVPAQSQLFQHNCNRFSQNRSQSKAAIVRLRDRKIPPGPLSAWREHKSYDSFEQSFQMLHELPVKIIRRYVSKVSHFALNS